MTHETAQTREALVEVMAAAIANARGGRRGMLTVTNIMELLPDNLLAEVRSDARAAVLAFLDAAMGDSDVMFDLAIAIMKRRGKFPLSSSGEAYTQGYVGDARAALEALKGRVK